MEAVKHIQSSAEHSQTGYKSRSGFESELLCAWWSRFWKCGYDTSYERNPGFGGQSYIHSVTDKIRELRRMLNEKSQYGYTG